MLMERHLCISASFSFTYSVHWIAHLGLKGKYFLKCRFSLERCIEFLEARR